MGNKERFPIPGGAGFVTFIYMRKTVKIMIYLGWGIFLVLANGKPAYADERPVSSNVQITPATITLTEATDTGVAITATVTDADGCAGITGVTVKLFKTDLTSSCTPDPNNCYAPVAMTQVSCTDTIAEYAGSVNVSYYAEPGEWSAAVVAPDAGGAGTQTGDGDPTALETLRALDVTGTIAFGSLDLGDDTGTADQTTTVTNTGNIAIGVAVDGYGASNGDGKSLICSSGSIPLANEKYAKTESMAYFSKTVLTDTAAPITDFTIAKRTDAAATGNIYWGLGIPENGAGGSCSGRVVFTAI